MFKDLALRHLCTHVSTELFSFSCRCSASARPGATLNEVNSVAVVSAVVADVVVVAISLEMIVMVVVVVAAAAGVAVVVVLGVVVAATVAGAVAAAAAAAPVVVGVAVGVGRNECESIIIAVAAEVVGGGAVEVRSRRRGPRRSRGSLWVKGGGSRIRSSCICSGQ